MSSVINGFSADQNYTNHGSDDLFSRNNVSTNENVFRILTDRLEPFDIIHANVRSDAPVVICYSPQYSSLRSALIAYLTAEDITLITFSEENRLWQWLDSNSSLTITSLVLQPIERSQELITHSHSYVCVRSILVRCQTSEFSTLKNFSMSYTKVHGVFDDDTRLLIKLVADLILFSEDLGDQLKKDTNREIEVERNYDRAIKLSFLIEKF